MEAWLQHLITQSLAWSLLAVGLVTFFESLALVGLLLPGTVLMASFGALIGSGQIGLYPAWAVGTLGCLLGDWISYFIGWQFKGPLHRWSFIKKHQKLMDKTEHALHEHSMFTIIVGRFVGPTRPLIPLVAGMLELPVRKFIPRISSAAFCGRRFTYCRGSSPGWRLMCQRMPAAASLSGCC
ncbi:hypothetical protein ERHA54_41310 [Erwinia rhapontici]|nr:hypothetical protein ERHA54_41310 [Erwinia rhapontici]